MRQSVFLLAITIVLFTCVAQADNKTNVNDPKAAAALLGEHRFTWQSISWTRFGKATITNDNGVYRLDAKQQSKNQYATVQGVVTEVNTRNFLFKGIIKTAENTGTGGAPCIREGEFTFFYRQQSSRGWRLSSMESPCGTGVDYLDIYITKHPWRPRLSKADKLASQWGIGILLKGQPGKNLTKTDVVPDATMQFHFRPNGPLFAITVPSQHYPVGLKRVPGRPHAVVQNTKDYVTLNYDAQAIVVHQRKDNFVAIFSNSLYQPGWVSEAELKTRGFRFYSWQDYFLQFPDNVYFARDKTALNLRAQPDVKAKKIVTLKTDLMQLRPTGKRQGLWIEVAVNQYSVHQCHSGSANIEKQFRGWIKVVDDRGFPNIWYYTKGC